MRELKELLETHRHALLRLVRREAQGLLDRDEAEDIVQDVHLRALRQAQQFTYRGEAEFLGWLAIIARQQIADRHDHWTALRRQAGALLRVTSGGESDVLAVAAVNLRAAGAGPATFAERREIVARAMRALALLPRRDRDLVALMSQGLKTAEIAGRLDLSPAAAESALRRAVDRFRKTFALLAQRRA